MERERHLDVFVDETAFSLNGRPFLIYGAVATSSMAAAIAYEEEIREQYRLPKELEIKWGLEHQDAVLKATVKQELLTSMSKYFTWLVTVNGGNDKDAAFLRSLDQIKDYAKAKAVPYLNVYYDEDTFRRRGPVEAALAAWEGVRCTNFAKATSKHSVGMEYADVLAGAYGYMVQARFSGRSTVARPPADGHGYFEDWHVDDMLGVMLRWNSWGDQPEWADGAPPSEDHMIRDCLGRGVVLAGDLTEEERASLRRLTRFWLGCTR